MRRGDEVQLLGPEIEQLLASGRPDEAAKRTRRLLRKFPGNATLLFYLGVVAGAQNDFATAFRLFRDLCDSGRGDFRAHLLMCRALESIDASAASDCYAREFSSPRWGQEQIRELHEAYLSFLGVAGKYEEIFAFMQANPSVRISAEVDLFLVKGIEAVHGVEAAIEHLELSPYTNTSALHRFNLGALYEKLVQIDSAVRAYEGALELQPLLDDAAYNLGILELCQCKFDRGWDHYARRWAAKGFKSKLEAGGQDRKPITTIRSVSELAGKHIQLLPEQGLGEQLLFLTCINELASVAASVRLSLGPRLMSALRFVPQMEKWVVNEPHRSPRPEISLPLGVLPQLFRRDQSCFPPLTSVFNSAKGDFLASVQAVVDGAEKVGLCLSSSSLRFGEAKSITAEAVSGVVPELHRVKQLVNLDHAVRASPEASSKLRDVFPNIIFPEGLDGASGLNRLVEELLRCDAVVTVSCTVAHFAGVLGIPCFVVVNDWVLSKYWYWNHTSNDGTSMWYPTIRVVNKKGPQLRGPSTAVLHGNDPP